MISGGGTWECIRINPECQSVFTIAPMLIVLRKSLVKPCELDNNENNINPNLSLGEAIRTSQRGKRLSRLPTRDICPEPKNRGGRSSLSGLL